MGELTITVQELIKGYPATPLSADAADITWTAAGADFADGAAFLHTGNEVILIRNSNVAAKTVAIYSAENARFRGGDIEDYSVGAGQFAAFGPFPVDGWRQTDGMLNLKLGAADMYVAVVRVGTAVTLPA